MPRLSRTRGLTLLELVIAIFVLAIGSLVALRATDQSRHAISGELPRLLAETAARNRVQELQLLGPYAALPDTVVIGGQNLSLTQARERTEGGLIRVTLQSRAQSGEAVGFVLYLPPEIPQ